MKIGILTFHWATNYGAILQALAMQEYLKKLGHDVSIINYKPLGRDYSLKYMFIHPRTFLNPKAFVFKWLKERKLSFFRKDKLQITKTRYYNSDDLYSIKTDFNAIISGSDQVLRPDYTIGGDGKDLPTPAYFLQFAPPSVKRIAYAVSYGCESYPDKEGNYAKRWINAFDFLGVREKTGVNVSKQLGYDKGIFVVPDPTILFGNQLFIATGLDSSSKEKRKICVYSLRHRINVPFKNVVYIDDYHRPYSMKQWINLIASSKFFITNSFHGLVVALFNHVPFAVELETGRGSGMNDRFYTLLNDMSLQNRIIRNDEDHDMALLKIKDLEIDWDRVDRVLETMKMVGEVFLNSALS